MVKSCFVFNCKTGRKSDRNTEHKYSLFKAPNDVALFEKWRNIVPLRERELKSNDRICEKHFEKRYVIPRFQETVYGDFFVDHIRPKLTPNAVPTIFPDTELRENPVFPLKQRNEKSDRPVLEFLLPHIEVKESDTVPICYKCLLAKCSLHRKV